MTLFQDPEMVDHLYGIICQMGASARIPAIIDRLREDLRNAKTVERRENVVRAFIAIGLGDDSEVCHVLDRVGDCERFDIITRRNHVSAEVMIDHLGQAGLLDHVGTEALQHFATDWLKPIRYLAVMPLL